MVVVVGGLEGHGGLGGRTPLSDVWLLDVTNKQWKQVSIVIKFSVVSSPCGPLNDSR